MISIEQAKNGLMRYIDTDMLPKLDGVKRIGLGIYAALAGNNLAALAERYANHPAIAMLGVMDDAHNIDLDKLYEAAIHAFADGDKIILSIPMIGDYTIDHTDVDKLYRYMKG